MKPGFDGQWHERTHWWRSLLLRLALCIGATALSLRWGGWTGALVTLMLWGRVFARDLIEWSQWALRLLRGRAMAPVEGRFFAFKGQRIEVLDDDIERVRWIAVADLAAALGEPISERALGLRFAPGLRREGKRLFLRDDEALRYLGERQAERALRLRRWVEQEVWHPARGRRANYEVKKKAPQAEPGAPSQE